MPDESPSLSSWTELSRDDWAGLRGSTPLTLSEADLAALHGLDEQVSLDEVREVYLPLSRLLNLHVAAATQLFRVTDTFLGHRGAQVPYVIGIAGSVSVGKSTTARILRELLSRWPEHPRVDLVTTDGFLFPNQVLEERGLMHRKGFPESYDLRALIQFLREVKAGREEVRAPVYSHHRYDVLAGEHLSIRHPDILILEGLNVLQTGAVGERAATRVFVSDFFDFSIYIDAAEQDLEAWYLERFRRLRDTAFQDERSFFHDYARVPAPEALAFARRIWANVNAVNLHENVAPTRERARLILEKGPTHRVERVKLRKM